MVKKLLALVAIAAAGYFAYSRITASKQERDLWNEATSSPDLR